MGDEPEHKPITIGFRDCEKCGTPIGIDENKISKGDKYWCSNCINNPASFEKTEDTSEE